MKRGLRWLLLSVVWLLALSGILLAWSVHSGQAAIWLVRSGVQAVPGLSVVQVQGTLASGLALAGVRYQHENGLLLSADELWLALDWQALWRPALRVGELHLAGVRVQLPRQQPVAVADSAPVSLPLLPLPVSLAAVCVQQLQVQDDQGGVLAEVARLTARADWRGRLVQLHQMMLDVSQPEMLSLALAGEVRLTPDWPLALDAQWHSWLAPGEIKGQLMVLGQADDWLAELGVTGDLDGIGPLTGQWQLTGDLQQSQLLWGESQLLAGRVDWQQAIVNWAQGLTLSLKAQLHRLALPLSGEVDWQLDTQLDAEAGMAQDMASLRWSVQLDDLHLHSLALGQQLEGRLSAQGDAQSARQLRVQARLLGDRPVEADWQGAVSWHTALTVAGGLTAQGGTNQLQLSGQLLPTPQLAFSLQAPDLAWLPGGVSGRVEAEGQLQGNWQTVQTQMQLSARQLRWQDREVSWLAAQVLADGGEVHAGLLAEGLAGDSVGGQVALALHGRAEHHRLRLDGRWHDARVSGWLEGRLSDAQRWQGQLLDWSLSDPQLGDWRQLAASGVSLSSAQVRLLAPWCLTRDASALCVQGEWTPKQTRVQIQGERLWLSWLRPWLPDALLVPGSLALNGSWQSGAGQQQGRLTVELPDNMLVLAGSDGVSHHAYRQVSAQASLKGSQLSLQLSGEMDPGLTLRSQGKVTLGADPRLEMTGQLDLASLDAWSHAHEAVQSLSGSLQARWRLAGRLASPALNLTLQGQDLSAMLPATGVHLRLPSLQVRMQADGSTLIDGRLLAGDGQGRIQGTADLSALPKWKLDLAVTGEQLLLADLPQARVWVSPDVRLRASPAGALLTGQLLVPKARIVPRSLPAKAVGLSPDVVLVGEQEQGVAFRLTPQLLVRLGDDVRLDGAGLKARLSGELQARSDRTGALWAQGELLLSEGSYRAYGQDLTLEQGQLMFQGPLDKPGVSLRASRKAGDYEAGVDVQGSLQRAEIRVFSRPALSDSDALGVLITGRRLQDVSGAEAALLMSALAEGEDDPLLTRIGNEVGLDVGVSSVRGEQSAGVSLGKRLGPDLYVRYVVGAFEYGARLITEYRINRFFSVEVQTGRASGGDVFYRLETD